MATNNIIKVLGSCNALEKVNMVKQGRAPGGFVDQVKKKSKIIRSKYTIHYMMLRVT